MCESVNHLALSRTACRFSVREGLIALALGAAAGFSATASLATEEKSASPDTGQLDEIVVTARKRVENLRDVPASITAIAASTIEDAHLYVNDVQLFEGKIIRPNDIERIEVLKGPQGTFYGGANIGGAIKYVTKEPTATWESQATVEGGNYGTRNYQAVLSGPLDAGDKLGLRASFYDENREPGS
jgi:iron complex outermembrane receptor protein